MLRQQQSLGCISSSFEFNVEFNGSKLMAVSQVLSSGALLPLMMSWEEKKYS
jgi:hypothetical protein